MTAPPGSDTLDPGLTGRYGHDDEFFRSGFQEPWSIFVYSGGPIDASYLGGDCRGYAEPNPDYDLRFYLTGVSYDALLRFYFVANTGGDDATLIVNDAHGDWLCNDDSYGTRNPTVNLVNPAEGWYDIWIGSYSAGENIPGYLHVTQLDSMHP